MLKCTRRWSVVFTQGFPALERFAQQNFLPSHPLSSSCLWLDEDDFENVQRAARAFNVVNPLRIDPYAHHPRLSRFAPVQAGKAAGQKIRGLGAADTVPEMGSRAATPTSVRAPAASDSVAVGGPSRGSAPIADISKICSELNTEEATSSRTRKELHAENKALSARRGRQTHLAEDLSNYRVPICMLSVTKPLYVFNMDQMYLSDSDGISMSSLAVEDFGRTKVDDYGVRDNTLPTLWSQQQHIAEGARELQLRFPNPIGNDANNRGSRCMYSICTRRPYSRQREHSLNTLVHRHGYRSHWWGTYRQWRSIGATPQPGQTEHAVPIPFMSKIVHISLIENAKEVLQRCIIVAKNRKLVFVFLSPSAHHSDPESGDTVREALATENTLHEVNLTLLSDTARHHCHDVTSFDRVLLHVLDDMRVQRWTLPVYFTLRHIQRLGLELRPEAAGVLPNTARAAGLRDNFGATEPEDRVRTASAVGSQAGTSDTAPRAPDDTEALSPEPKDASDVPCAASTNTTLRSLETPTPVSIKDVEYWYHISQVFFPDSYLVPSAVLTAEFESPGVPLNGASGRRLLYPALLYDSLIYQHPEIAEAVRCASVSEALHHAGDTASGGSRGLTDGHGSVGPESTMHQQEEPREHRSVVSPPSSIAAGIDGSAGKKVGEEDEAISRFVATHASPKHTRGRSLWYKAEDVLAAGGIVDVNSAPVEVGVCPNTRLVGRSGAHGLGLSVRSGEAELPGSMLYNVECLTDPDKALRLLSEPFDPM